MFQFQRGKIRKQFVRIFTFQSHLNLSSILLKFYFKNVD